MSTRKSLREIMEIERAVAERAKADAEEAAARAKADAEEAAARAKADAAEAAAQVKTEADAVAARIARGDNPCWCCEKAGITAFHKCKENVCPTATKGYTRFHRDGSPNTAYPAHPLREYYSAPGMPSHSNNYYKRAFAEYDREEARIRAREAAKVRAAEEATGLEGQEAVAEFKKLTKPPCHGFAEYFDALTQ